MHTVVPVDADTPEHAAAAAQSLLSDTAVWEPTKAAAVLVLDASQQPVLLAEQ